MSVCQTGYKHVSSREHLAWILARLRSGREHWSRVAVEEDEEEKKGGGGGGEEQATDIKSNNPHLTGGE